MTDAIIMTNALINSAPLVANINDPEVWNHEAQAGRSDATG